MAIELSDYHELKQRGIKHQTSFFIELNDGSQWDRDCDGIYHKRDSHVTYDSRGNRYVDGLRYVNDEVGYVDEDEEYY